ncbi:hypothetical protein ABW19_dt0208886 [Dactylella cylindrospora]|nr:hypothetical protein ABW19_dt0208886 [Dactylella cylindrospora]
MKACGICKRIGPIPMSHKQIIPRDKIHASCDLRHLFSTLSNAYLSKDQIASSPSQLAITSILLACTPPPLIRTIFPIDVIELGNVCSVVKGIYGAGQGIFRSLVRGRELSETWDRFECRRPQQAAVIDSEFKRDGVLRFKII